MLYAFQLRAHSNARYQVSLLSLSQKELACMLAACGVEADVFTRTLGGTPFLCFEADTLTPAQQAFLAGASGVYMTAALQGDLLKPLDLALPAFLPNDMPEVLKYKGKTNSDFTRMLINLALAAGGRWNTQRPYILDPLCGRGTTLFCALTRGMNAIGIENDRKSVQEGLQYADKWLQYHRLKHATERSSLTLPQGGSVPRTMLRVTGEDQTERQITFLQTDTRNCGSLLKKHPADALVADLPYGVQHAPQAVQQHSPSIHIRSNGTISPHSQKGPDFKSLIPRFILIFHTGSNRLSIVMYLSSWFQSIDTIGGYTIVYQRNIGRHDGRRSSQAST